MTSRAILRLIHAAHEAERGPLVGGELSLGLADLALADANVTIAGHIHAPQVWEYGGKRVAYYAHPGMFRQRAAKLPDGNFRLMEDVPSVHALGVHGADVVVTTEPQGALGGLIHVSGEIARVTPYETGLPGQHRRTDDGKGWEPDELLMDERFVAINVKGKGLVVLSACSHAGVVNVLTHARASFPGVPLHCVLGGLHLSGTNERIIPQTVEALKGFGLTTIAAGHCTGWRAMTALANTFGDQVLTPLAVGKRMAF